MKINNFFNFIFKREPDIVPFTEYYPTFDIMNYSQKRSYHHIVKSILSQTHVEIHNFISYLFCFLFEQTKTLLHSNNYKQIIKNIKLLQNLYPEYPSVVEYCQETCADIYFCYKEYNKYFEIQEKIIAKKGIKTHLGNELLYAKYKLHKDITGYDLISITHNLTKYGREHIDEIVQIINILLQVNSQYSRKTILEDIAQEEIKNKHLYPLSLFCGNPYGFELNEKFCSKRNDYICFYANKRFLNLINELTRVAENMLREQQGLPKVNEGWLEETKLFYAIKNLYPNLSVTHQYRASFLGRQSIDIFIEDYKIAIEYQGPQHFRPIDFFGGEEGYKEILKRDKRKKMICKKNNINLLYYEEGYKLKDVQSDIDNIIKQKLSS